MSGGPTPTLKEVREGAPREPSTSGRPPRPQTVSLPDSSPYSQELGAAGLPGWGTSWSASSSSSTWLGHLPAAPTEKPSWPWRKWAGTSQVATRGSVTRVFMVRGSLARGAVARSSMAEVLWRGVPW